jgi:hypothetical protein
MGEAPLRFCLTEAMTNFQPLIAACRVGRGGASVIIGGLLAACAPALDWRDVKVPEADGLQAQFPCKPDHHARRVAWPGTDGVTMHLLSCQAEEATWALSYLTLPDATLVGPALLALATQMQTNLVAAAKLAGAAQPVSQQDVGAVAVPHMTAMPQARAWQFVAQRADGLGRPLTVRIKAWHFSHGLTVFQSSVSQPFESPKAQTSEDMADAFFRGFHFPA